MSAEALPQPAAGASADSVAAPSPPPLAPEQMAHVLEQIDFLRQGDQFWCRGVQYLVVEELPKRNAVVIAPTALDRETRKKMKKAGRPR